MSRFLLAIATFALVAIAKTPMAAELRVDGVLDEEIWLDAKVFNEFVVMQPKLFQPPVEATLAYIASDEKGLYVAFINQQANFDAVGQVSLFDQDIQGDYNQVIIDFEGNGSRGYGLRLSRSNAVQDGVWLNENQERIDWNGKWRHATATKDASWTSEIFIPWSSFSMTSAANDTRQVSIYLARWHQEMSQKFAYPAIDPSQSLFLSKFMPIEIGSTDYSSIDWFPYVSTRFDRLADDVRTQAGLDVFWRPSSDKQLNLTINPDFAQVESDELVVNFSAIESFFEEKRPFFVENHAMFDVRGEENLMLVNTRRIGAKEEGSKRIEYAARFTHFADSFEYGVLAAKEQNETNLAGRDFLSARWSLVGEAYSFGLLFNHTQDTESRRKARVVASDWVYEFNDNWQISSLLVQSNIDEELAGAEDKRAGVGWSVSLAHQVADNWQQSLSVMDYGRKLEVNDFGFSERVDLKQFSYDSIYEWPMGNESWGIADHALEIGVDLLENQEGQRLINEYDLTFIVNTQKNQEIEFELEYQQAGMDDLFTFGHHPVRLPEGYGLKLSYKSDQTRRLVWDMSASTGKAGLSEHWRELEFEPTLQIGDDVHLGLEITYLEQDSWLLSLFEEDEEEFMFDEGILDDIEGGEEEDGENDEELDEESEDYPSENLVGHYRQKELSIGIFLAARWAHKHELSIKVESVSVKAKAREQFLAMATGYLQRLDEAPESFSESEFLMQIRYRYEISSLSSIYVVYGRGGESDVEHVGHSNNRLMKNAFDNRDEENIVVKATFLF